MRRIPEFDALRGIAAVGIVMFHFTYPGPLFHWFFFAWWMSLEIFFVLSGYLITSIILEQGGRRGFFRAFYARRTLRIWPIYFLFLGSSLLVRWWKPGIGPIEGWPQYSTFTQNMEFYVTNRRTPFLYFFEPTWSLAIEEQFYLIWPLLVLWAGAHRGRSWPLLGIAAGAVGLSIALRMRGFHATLLLARSDGFAMGGVLALLVARLAGRSARGLQWGALGAVMAGAAYLTIGHWVRGLPMLEQADPFSTTAAALASTGVVTLVLFASGSAWLSLLRTKGLRYLGTVSYGIYLYHLACLIVADVLMHALRLPSWMLLWLAVPICGISAVISWELVESPILRLKSRFRYVEDGADSSMGVRPTELEARAELVNHG